MCNPFASLLAFSKAYSFEISFKDHFIIWLVAWTYAELESQTQSYPANETRVSLHNSVLAKVMPSRAGKKYLSLKYYTNLTQKGKKGLKKREIKR